MNLLQCKITVYRIKENTFFQNKIVFWVFTNPLLIENVHT